MTPGPIGKGSKMRMDRKDPGLRSTLQIEVTRFETDHVFAFVGTGRKLDFDGILTIHSEADQTSLVTIEADMRPKRFLRLFSSLMRPVVRKQLREALGRIKQGVEVSR